MRSLCVEKEQIFSNVFYMKIANEAGTGVTEFESLWRFYDARSVYFFFLFANESKYIELRNGLRLRAGAGCAGILSFCRKDRHIKLRFCRKYVARRSHLNLEFGLFREGHTLGTPFKSLPSNLDRSN